MKRLFFSVILGAAIVGLAYYAVTTHNEEINELQFERDQARLRIRFEERAAGIHGQSNTERRVDELTSEVKWYNSELASLCNRFPGKCHPDAYLEEAEAAAAAGHPPADLDLRKEYSAEAKDLYQKLLTGAYKPLATADVEGIRLDLLSLHRAQDNGKSRLRMDVVVWGAPEQLIQRQDLSTQGEAALKRQYNLALESLSMEFINDDDKLVGGMDGGPPREVIDAPDELYKNFPPQGALMVWYLDPFPAETDHLTIKITGDVKSPTNGALPISTEWALQADPEWRVKPGETFQGEQRMMPAEDLDRKPHAQK